MTDALAEEARQRHAALIEATLRAVDALPPLAPEATPQSFAAYKAAQREGTE